MSKQPLHRSFRILIPSCQQSLLTPDFGESHTQQLVHRCLIELWERWRTSTCRAFIWELLFAWEEACALVSCGEFEDVVWWKGYRDIFTVK